MFDPKIKLSRALFEKLKEVASTLGCSVDEFCEQVLEKEADRALSKSGRKEATAAEVEDIANKLKGLGYLE
ncbi:MAG: hypothetical protein QY326_08895 [Bdellovibrionota bacterium]|nr:MAG: hypothetical protein QY326_08895 [Bdellovibrionota bacterium]